MPERTPKKLTAERARALLSYDPDMGVFTWKDCYFRSKNGKPAGRPARGGYIVVSIDGYPYSAGPLAWLYMTGEWPLGVVDHRDTDPGNNRFKNLRDVVDVVNSQNQRRAHADSTTGILGIKRHGNGFGAQISLLGKTVWLGTFPTEALAHKAYLDAKRRHHEGCTL